MLKISNFIKAAWKMPFFLLSKNISLREYFEISRQSILILIQSKSLFSIGQGSKIGNFKSPGFFSYSYIEVRDGSNGLLIKNNTLIGNRFVLISKSRVEIGNNCLIGNDVKIYDSDFHSLSRDRRSDQSRSIEVIIGDNVFIGDNVIILKGVQIGDGAVIGAGSVVSKNVDQATIYAGNPARKISKIDGY